MENKEEQINHYKSLIIMKEEDIMFGQISDDSYYSNGNYKIDKDILELYKSKLKKLEEEV